MAPTGTTKAIETEERLKPVIIQDNSTGEPQYTLAFTRDTVRFAEMNGFDTKSLSEKYVSTVEMLFYYAFRAHHRQMSKRETDKILRDIGASPELVERLIGLYMEVVESMMKPTGDEKNARLRVIL